MKKFLSICTLLMLFFLFFPNHADASTSNFSIKDFQADYYLGKNNSGHSTLKTVENITATFPDYDQNHGIERYLPMSYDKHRVDLSIESVTDANNNDVKYSTSRSGDNLVLRIGDANKYVHGDNKYVITYSQKNITKFFEDSGDDEFYWDVNGTGWSQSFLNVSARIHIDANIVDGLSGDMSCYYGPVGSNNRCDITRAGDVIGASITNLGPNENMTFAIGFKKGSFSEYKPNVFDFISDNLVVIESAVLVLLFVVVLIIRIFIDKDAPGRPTIIAEYLPPKGLDIPMASLNFNYRNSWVAATLVDLAVRRNIKMISVEGKGIFAKRKFIIEYLSDKNLSNFEFELIHAFFGSNPVVSQQYEINSNKTNMKLIQGIRDVRSSIDIKARTEGYFTNHPGVHRIMYSIAIFMLAQALVLSLIFQKSEDDLVAVIIIAGISVFMAVFLTAFSTPRSAKSSEIRDHLKGLKLYIKTAEEDRIKYLQSPKGTLRDSVDVSDGVAVLSLYERLLPYAIIMGVEKDWSSVLSEYYQKIGNDPYWYSGRNTFSSGDFINDISLFSSATSSSTSYTSSSSGGSSGGGSSGGGGGGGGGGGW